VVKRRFQSIKKVRAHETFSLILTLQVNVRNLAWTNTRTGPISAVCEVWKAWDLSFQQGAKNLAKILDNGWSLEYRARVLIFLLSLWFRRKRERISSFSLDGFLFFGS